MPLVDTNNSHLLMPNERIGNIILPTPGNEVFDSITDACNIVKAYAKEVGFSIVVEDKTNQLMRRIRCSKAIDI